MGPTVPPQDAQAAIDGILMIAEQHNILSVPWFQIGEFWSQVLGGCIRALLSQAQPTNRDSILDLFKALSKSDLSHASHHLPALAGGFWSAAVQEVRLVVLESGGTEGLATRFLPTSAQGLKVSTFATRVLDPLAAEIAKLKE